MQKRHFFILFNILCFCSLAISGFVLMFKSYILSNDSGRFFWLVIHVLSALIFLFLAIFHLSSQWAWIKQNILSKQLNNQSKRIKKICNSNICLFLLFLTLVITGYIMIFFDTESELLKIAHNILGVTLTVMIVIHIIRHKDFVKKDLKKVEVKKLTL